MGCLGGRLLLLAMLLSATLNAASFKDCFSAEPLYRFWAAPGYVYSNPNIVHLYGADFYQFNFDAMAQKESLFGARFAAKEELPAADHPGFGAVQQHLSKAAGESAGAEESRAAAHDLARKAKPTLETLANPLLAGAYAVNVPFLRQYYQDSLNRYPDVDKYINEFPAAYWDYHESAASSYEFSLAASRAMGALLDSKVGELYRAGAASHKYSGKARGAYLEAQNALASSSSFCAQAKESHQEALEYYLSSPALPDLSLISFREKLLQYSGAQNSSALARMGALYSALSQAQTAMQDEYDQSERSAESSINYLGNRVDSLEKQQLGLIGDLPSGTSVGKVSVSSEFSGIASAFVKIKEEYRSAQDMALEAKRLSASQQQDHLSEAIWLASEAEKKANAAAYSADSVESASRAAVGGQRGFAEFAIATAEKAISFKASSTADATSLEDALKKLSAAKAEFVSADSKATLGAQFESYSRAISLAVEAQSAAENRAMLADQSAASKSLAELSSLIGKAAKDGLDVDYERSKHSDLYSLSKNSQSSQTQSAVQRAAEDEKSALLLRVRQHFSLLEGKFAGLKEKVGAIRQLDPSFAPQFDSLSRGFPGGKADLAALLGDYRQTDSSIDSLLDEAQQASPKYLSSYLSSHVRVQVLSQIPSLTKTVQYRLEAVAENPSAASSSIPMQLSFPSEVPLLRADFAEGTPIIDAYWSDGTATVVVPSVGPEEKIRLVFEKQDRPSQVTSSSEECGLSTQSLARLSRRLSVFSSRPLKLLEVEQQLPDATSSATLKHGGISYPLLLRQQEGGKASVATIGPVAEGRSELVLEYEVQQPFSYEKSDVATKDMGGGMTQVGFRLEVSGIKQCDSASMTLNEPFDSISGLSALPLGGAKVESATAAFGTIALRVGSLSEKSAFQLSYTAKDAKGAFDSSVAQLESRAASLGRTGDLSELARARSLYSSNQTGAALVILDYLQKTYSDPSLETESARFSELNQTASILLAEGSAEAASILGNGGLADASDLTSLLADLRQSQSSSETLLLEGSAKKASTSLSSAISKYQSSLADLSWKKAKAASDNYAKSVQKGNYAPEALARAETAVSGAHTSFSSGDYLGSLGSSSSASLALSEDSNQQSKRQEEIGAALDGISSQFSRALAQAETTLRDYSRHYSSLSAQSKRRLPITPTAAQQEIDAAKRSLAAAAKASPSPQSLSDANNSLAALSDAASLLSSSMESLQHSAASSLGTAKAALSELRARQADPAQTAQIEREVAQSEAYFAEGLPADSLASSERAIAAANVALASSGALDFKAIALAALSLLFLSAAAVYFLKRGKIEKKEKRGMPKAD